VKFLWYITQFLIAPEARDDHVVRVVCAPFAQGGHMIDGRLIVLFSFRTIDEYTQSAIAAPPILRLAETIKECSSEGERSPHDTPTLTRTQMTELPSDLSLKFFIRKMSERADTMHRCNNSIPVARCVHAPSSFCQLLSIPPRKRFFASSIRAWKKFGFLCRSLSAGLASQLWSSSSE